MPKRREAVWHLRMVGVPVTLSSRLEAADEALLAANFAAFDRIEAGAADAVQIHVEAQADGYRIHWVNSDEAPVLSDRYELVHHVEGFLVIALQLARPDLLFMHAAALVHKEQGILISGDSGRGKSTLCWALTQHGFAYLSDELAPTSRSETGGVRVEPYPHALNLKRSPPPPYAIPKETPCTGWTHHIPAATLAGGLVRQPARVDHLFLVSLAAGEPAVAALSPADAAFRLYPNLLNTLAHPGAGLKAATELAQALKVYEISSGDLADTCALLLDTITS